MPYCVKQLLLQITEVNGQIHCNVIITVFNDYFDLIKHYSNESEFGIKFKLPKIIALGWLKCII